jgi:hypothetical protein
MSGFENVIWGNKKFSDLLKEVHSNSREKERTIKELIGNLKPLITDQQSALTIVPLISNYLNIGVKNDEQLIKLASIVQRIISNSTTDNESFILSESEKEQLLNAVNDIKEEQDNDKDKIRSS